MVTLNTSEKVRLGQDVPEDVKKQKEEADELLRQLEEGAGDPGDPGSHAPGEEPPSPLTAPESEEDAETLKRQVEDLTKALSDLQAENSETWKHKFQVIEGKYRAEIQPASARIRELEGENQRLRDAFSRVGSKAPQAPLSEEDQSLADELGVDEDIYRKMQERLGGGSQRQAVAQPAAEPARKAFFALLDVKAPGWREARTYQEFAMFLNETHESVGGVAGRTLFEVLQEADGNSDADQVARIYNVYFKRSRPRKSSREAAPTSNRGGGRAPAETDMWSMERIQKFEEDVATGKIKMGSKRYLELKASRDAYLETQGF